MRYVTEPTPGSPADRQDDADPEQVARTILLRRLSVAPRTRSELRTDLLRRGLPEEVADRVLDRFAEVGLIDDTSYAQSWVESRQRTRGSARGILRQELRSKGISDDDAALALEGIDEDAERARAVQLVAGEGALDGAARARGPGPAAGVDADAPWLPARHRAVGRHRGAGRAAGRSTRIRTTEGSRSCWSRRAVTA